MTSFRCALLDLQVLLFLAIDPGTLPARVNLDILRQVEQDNPSIFEKHLAYDGKKIAYASYDVPLGGSSRTVGNLRLVLRIYFLTYLFQFEVTLAPKNGGTAPKAGGRPPRVYKLKLSQAAMINTEYV